MNKLFLILLIPLNLSFAQTNFWQQTNGPQGGTISDYAIDSAGIIYGGSENGVFKSTDNGISWSYAGLQGKLVYSICTSSAGAIFAGSYNEGLYLSTNGGLNWQTTDLFTSYITDLYEVQNGIIFAATVLGVFKSINNGINWNITLPDVTAYSISKSQINNKVYVSCLKGLYSSSDFGNNWLRVESLNEIYLREVNIADNGFIFVAGTESRLFRSTDNGNSFSIMHHDSIYKPSCVTTTPNGFVYCATTHEGIWRSTNNGDNWINLGYNHETTRLFRGKNNEVFATIYSLGSVKSIDGGLNWISTINGIVNTFVNALIKTSDGKILSSTGQVSSDGGMNWYFPLYPFVTSDFAINNKNGFLFAVNATNGVFRSTDNGANWIFYGVNSTSFRPGWITISDSTELYAGRNGGVYKSTNQGINWTQFTSTFLTSFTKNKLNHYFGGGTGGIFKSTNEGQTWSMVLSFPNTGNYYYNPVLLASDNSIYAGGTAGLFRSTDDGINWVNEGIPGKVCKIMESENGKLFVTCYDYYYMNTGGVYKKSGNSWQDITYNLEWRNIGSICFNDEGQLLVGTNGTGVSRSINNVIGINNINSSSSNDYKLFQNYPNPFNPNTLIRYSLPENNLVNLKVYDVLGKVVATLVNQKQNAGSYEVEFDAGNFASGIYFYKLEAGSFIETKRMMLIK